MSLLYLLVSSEATAVKVGVSVDPRIRAAQLSESINLEESLEIELRGGSASSVERMLHYLFRDYSQYMPPGDGCTEWFRLEALPDIIQFLNNESKRLGISAIRPLHPPVVNPPDTAKAERQRTKLLKLEAQRLRQEQRARNYVAALAVAAEQNARVLEWIQRTFEEMDARNQIVGILPPTPPDESADGNLYLKGGDLRLTIDQLIKSELSTVQTAHGWRNIFSSSFSYPNYARVSISGILLRDSLPEDYDQKWPGLEAIRAYLHARAAQTDSPNHHKLIRLHRRTRTEEAKFQKAFDQNWYCS